MNITVTIKPGSSDQVLTYEFTNADEAIEWIEQVDYEDAERLSHDI